MNLRSDSFAFKELFCCILLHLAAPAFSLLVCKRGIEGWGAKRLLFDARDRAKGYTGQEKAER
jgi:hypothetical protein